MQANLLSQMPSDLHPLDYANINTFLFILEKLWKQLIFINMAHIHARSVSYFSIHTYRLYKMPFMTSSLATISQFALSKNFERSQNSTVLKFRTFFETIIAW